MTEPMKVSAPAEFVLSVRVYYEDTDAAGVVYHANYLRFMERARTEWLRSLGHEPAQLQHQEDLVFVVRSMQLRFLEPARHDDLLQVSAHLLKLRRASLYIGQEVKESGTGRLLCSAEVDVAGVDAAGLRPRTLPQWLQEQLSRVGTP